MISAVLVSCMLLFFSISVFASSPEQDFEKAITALGEKYGVTITAEDRAQGRRYLSKSESAKELEILEEHLKIGQNALAENNRAAEENWNALLASGRLNEDTVSDMGTAPRLATHTVYRYQAIGYYYPNATTIRCYLQGERVFSEFHNRHLWAGIVSKGSSLFSGKGDSWEETDCTTSKIDGGRTFYVQVWGDLTEKYTSWFKEYTVTSKGWRIYYEAVCPS